MTLKSNNFFCTFNIWKNAFSNYILNKQNICMSNAIKCLYQLRVNYILIYFPCFQVPNDHYLLLPTVLSQFKMSLLNLLPQDLAQYWASRKYRKSLPRVVPQSPNLSSRLSHASFRSTTNSTISSSMTSTSF